MKPDSEGIWPVMLVDYDFDDAGLSVSAVRIYVHLWRRADNKTRTAWPGINSMARIARIHKTTVERAIRELEWRGFIRVERKFGVRSKYEILPKRFWQPLSKSDQSRMEIAQPSEQLSKSDRTVIQKRPLPGANGERKYYHRRITKKKNKEEVVANAPPHSSSDSFGFDKAKPANQEEVIAFFETDQTCIDAYCDKADAIAFWCKMEAKGWIRNVNGTNDWKVNARDYATNRWLPSGQLRGRDREEHVRKLTEEANSERKNAEAKRREQQEREAQEREVQSRQVPPTFEDFLAYGKSIGVSETDCKEQFQTWTAKRWKDENGAPIIWQLTLGHLLFRRVLHP